MRIVRWDDLLDRTVATFVQALAAGVLVDGFDVMDGSAWTVALVAAALAAVRAAARHVLASRAGADE